MDDSFVVDPDGDPLNPDVKDPDAKRRRTASRNKGRDGLRPVLIRKAFDAYMTHPLVPKFRRTTTKAVQKILEGWIAQGWAKGKGFERTIYRALGREKD
jgi:hypothetical protein